MKNWLNQYVVKAKQWYGTYNEQVARNRDELIRGSVLSPYNHPSYSDEKAAELYRQAREYEEKLSALKVEYGR